MDRSFLLRLIVMRTTRDAYVFAAILAVAGCRWLDRHRLF